MTENELATQVVDAAIAVHRAFGPGLLECVYEGALVVEIESRGLKVERQVPIPVRYRGIELGEAFRADLIVEEKLLLELKSVEVSPPVHKKQVLTYLRLTGRRLGLLLNFGAVRMADGVTRLVNGLPESDSPEE